MPFGQCYVSLSVMVLNFLLGRDGQVLLSSDDDNDLFEFSPVMRGLTEAKPVVQTPMQSVRI